MTEVEWNSAPVGDLLIYVLDNWPVPENPRSALRYDLSRKHMLLAYGILRRYWDNLNPQVKRAIEAWEPLEDDPSKKLPQRFKNINYINDLFLAPLHQGDYESETGMAMWLVSGWWPEARKNIWIGKELPKSWRPVIHDVFGNPFHAVTADPTWLAGPVPQLAESIYEDRSFDRLPILGDALEEAGCSDANILNHCRQPGEHARGCWVVDLLLGKK